MALGILIAGLLSAVFGTLVAVAMGLNLGSALVVYGVFGICGGITAGLAGLPILRSLGRDSAQNNRTLG